MHAASSPSSTSRHKLDPEKRIKNQSFLFLATDLLFGRCLCSWTSKIIAQILLLLLLLLPHMKQQMSSQSGFRNVITCFFMLMALLYLLYSNLVLSNNSSKDCPTTNLSLKELSSSNTSDPDPETGTSASAADTPLLHDVQRYDTQLKHVVFGIAASAHFWQNRKEYIKTWWRPKETRGVVWADQKVRARKDEGLPEIRLSEDTSRLKYTNPQGQRAALRISRIVSETLRLGLEDVRWFVMGDDDTVFVVENVVRVLQKYDHTQYYYIGGSSESHVQNIYFSYGMAFGGGGFAISYPLAVALEKMQDRCIDRYPGLFGSDDRMHACMAELGVPLTKEPGFHQYDVNGNLVGLLGAHPLAPLVSLHHIDFVEPVFPNKGRVESLQHLLDSGKLDSASLMQQSICYDTSRYWSISVAWGYVVQVMRGVMSPRELEMPTRTFLNWFRRADFISYAMNTRPVMRHPCEKPFLFYVSKVRYDPVRNQTIGIYYRHKAEVPPCRWRMESPERINSIVVIKSPDDRRWNRPARRDCCKVLPSKKNTSLFVWVGSCQKEEVIEFQEPQAA